MAKPPVDLEMAARLRKAREEDGRYQTAVEAARAMGVTESTYLGHENGSRGFQASAARYADFYRVNLDWLATSRGPQKKSDIVPILTNDMNALKRTDNSSESLTPDSINIRAMERDIPILGMGSCGEDGLFELNGQVHDHARRPPSLSGVKDAYALWVIGNSMFPWRKNGQLVYVHPHQPVNIGDYVVVQTRPESHGGPIGVYIKELTRRTAKDLRLRQYNPPEDVTIPMSKVLQVRGAPAIHRIIDWSELMGI